MKQKLIDAYMDVAERFSKLSTAKRLQVGCIVVKDDRIISIGYNGMPSGWTNECEYETTEENIYRGELVYYNVTKTKPEVIHAEANAIAKLAKSTEAGEGATVFCTHAPCIECAKQIYTAGIKTVFYKYDYRDKIGIEFLQKCKIEVIKLDEN